MHIRCTCESKLCACGLTVKTLTEIHLRPNERSFSNAPLSAPISSFVQALDKNKETVMCTMSFRKLTNAVTILVF